MPYIALIALVFALVFFVLSALNVPNGNRFNFIGAGLACCALAALLMLGPGAFK